MLISEAVLLDSNVLIYAHNKASPLHLHAQSLIKQAIKGNIEAVLAQQNLLEFFSIITDPRRIDKPIPTKEAVSLVKEYLNSPFRIIDPLKETIEILLDKVANLNIKDGRIFDVYLVATMLSNKIDSIITANINDFVGFSGIKVIDLTATMEWA